jgi:hypothetical protein
VLREDGDGRRREGDDSWHSMTVMGRAGVGAVTWRQGKGGEGGAGLGQHRRKEARELGPMTLKQKKGKWATREKRVKG